MQPLSVVIITKNEEKNIGRCLDSVASIADDVVVIDSFSTDRTREIALEKGARVFERAFDDFRGQKNFGLEKALFPHVLAIDADESPDEELQKSILEVKKSWAFDGYKMDMLTFYADAWIWHSGWHPDPKLRLFDTRKGAWRGKNPHEKFEFDRPDDPRSRSPRLRGCLLHFSFPTVESHWKKAETYSTLGAHFVVEKGKKVPFWRPFASSAAKFLKMYFLKRGFLDGRMGLKIAQISAWETFQKYQKARKIQRDQLGTTPDQRP